MCTLSVSGGGITWGNPLLLVMPTTGCANYRPYSSDLCAKCVISAFRRLFSSSPLSLLAVQLDTVYIIMYLYDTYVYKFMLL